MANPRVESHRILVHDGWDSGDGRSHRGKSLSWGYCSEAPATHARNRQETSLHSRRSQSRRFGHNLVATVPKIACTSPYVSDFKKYRYRRNLPYRPSSNLKFQTLHHMANLQKWRELLNTFYSFPNAVGMIDGTIHRINRPSNAEQAEFYRGDKRCHFMSTQLVVDADGLIVLLVTG